MSAPTGMQGSSDRRSEAAAGVVLIAIGLIALAAWAVPDVGRFAPLIVGLGLLAMFGVTRAYGFAVPAGIVTGVGAGVVLASSTDAAWTGGAFLLCLAAGFASVWLLGTLARPQELNAWPFIPAAIIGTVGLIALFGEETDLPVAQVVVAAVFVAIGVALILRSRAIKA